MMFLTHHANKGEKQHIKRRRGVTRNPTSTRKEASGEALLNALQVETIHSCREACGSCTVLQPEEIAPHPKELDPYTVGMVQPRS